MLAIATQTPTLTEFLALPETKPASEYGNGQIFTKPMPKGKHSALQGELVTLINHLLRTSRRARAFPELRCTFGDRSIVPDIATYTWERIHRDPNGEIANTFTTAPDWVIEILSPDQSQTRVIKNILHGLKHGTEMGWLLDASDRTVFVYRPHQETEVYEQPDAVLPVPSFASASFASNLCLTVNDLFALLFD